MGGTVSSPGRPSAGQAASEGVVLIVDGGLAPTGGRRGAEQATNSCCCACHRVVTGAGPV
ncbi:hypothetical protein ACF08N_26655 [Streptomyces sp. NPDC015127]|uniref:hypothetical protein n=1 Tax=Streptomyces sp. NPDC015127 TaxID=3364939 RepID=UPI0036F53A89